MSPRSDTADSNGVKTRSQSTFASLITPAALRHPGIIQEAAGVIFCALRIIRIILHVTSLPPRSPAR